METPTNDDYVMPRADEERLHALVVQLNSLLVGKPAADVTVCLIWALISIAIQIGIPKSEIQRMISDNWGKPMFVPASESKPN